MGKGTLPRQHPACKSIEELGLLDMNILFIGGFFDPHMEERILAKSRGPVGYAANKLQWNLIDGFARTDGVHLEAVSAPYVGAYPNDYRDLFVGRCEDTYDGLVRCKYVPFCNLWGYRNISRRNSVRRETGKFILRDTARKAIIIYSAHTPFLQAAVYAKEQDPSIHLCLIVTDLPHLMRLGNKQSAVYEILKAIDLREFQRDLRHVDSFVLLTEDMKYVLNVGQRPYIVVEGVVSISSDSMAINPRPKVESIKTILYTGTLAKEYGVTNLVRAFSGINDPNVRLLICGRGDCEDFVRCCASRDDRIRFLGQLSNTEAVKLQQSATILVNPRQNTEEFAKYSFPSKNMEYLLSGNPVIAYKLDGIPDDFDDHFFYVGDNSLESLRSKIVEVLSLTREERCEFAARAREFVISEKNNIKACARILSMIESGMPGKH